MLNNRALVFVCTDVKKERNQFADTIAIPGDPSFNGYNAGFDSSVVSARRLTTEAGIGFFSEDREGATNSFIVSLAFHHFDMNEQGLLHRRPYQRFYNVDQLSLSLQQNFLFKLSNSFKLAWIIRLSMLTIFKANTDYSASEKSSSGLKDNRTNFFMGFTGFYMDYHPVKSVPFYITGQLFNDLSMWKHSLAKYEQGRTYIKGTGASLGIRYILK